MLSFDLNHAQFLWLMVAFQLLIFGGMWLLATFAMKSFGQGLGLISLFNLLLCVSCGLVALRGTPLPDLLTRAGATLAGLAAFVAVWTGLSGLLNPRHSKTEPWLVLLLSSTAMVIFTFLPGYGNQRVAAQFVAVAWIIMRTAAFVTPRVKARFGKVPAHLLSLTGWSFVAVILTRAFGGLFLGWQIEIVSNHNQPGNLSFIFFIMACVTSINSLLAYLYMRSVVAEVESLARLDPLTGIPNRRVLNEQQALYWERWQRQQGRYAVICMDIDHFKRINDQHGHDVGDEVLQRVARALQAEIRPMDTLARTGGEEFVVLLDLHQPGEDMLQIAERLRLTVQGLEPWKEAKDRHITISLGVALPIPADTSPASVMTRADQALYLAKRKGRNRVELAAEPRYVAPVAA